MKKFSKALVVTLLTAGLTTSCASNAEPPQAWPTLEDSEGQPGPKAELPVGAELVDPANLSARSDQSAADQEPWGTIPPDAATVKQRVPSIRDRGRVIVGVGQYLNRLGFRDPLTGELDGFEVQLAHEIARDIFGDPNKVEFRYVENRRREAALRHGDVDMVIRTWTVSRDRQAQSEFSLPYLAIASQLLVKRNAGITGFGDLKDKTVCATRDSAPARTITQYQIGGLLLTRTWTDCLMAMQRNQVDAIYSDDAILSGLQSQDPYTELVGTEERASYYAVGMPAPRPGHDATGLVMQVNSTIQRIRSDGTWNRRYAKWLQDYLGPARSLPVKFRNEQESKQLAEERRRWSEANTLPSEPKVLGSVPREAFNE